MQIAVSGLGRMGAQIAQKLLEGGHRVVAHNRSPQPIEIAQEQGALAAYTKQEVIEAFDEQPPIIWIMLPAAIVDTEIDAWLELLPSNSILIDGGNSDYRGDKARAERASKKGAKLLDIGTSGGVWGYERGFSMMVGGDKPAYLQLLPVLDTLAAPGGGHDHFGASGAGHYVKMVHNAIEYGMMQSLAEGYRLLREGPYPSIDLASAGDVWEQNSVITSWLNDLTRQALHEDPLMEDVEGVVAESGEARWALETADEYGIPMPAIQIAFNIRLASQQGQTDFGTKLLAAMRHKFGGHDLQGK